MFRRILRIYWPLGVFLVFGIAVSIRAHLSLAEAAGRILATLAFVAVLLAAGRHVGKGPWI